MKEPHADAKPDRNSSRPRLPFDYQRFLARRERLAKVTFALCVVWWAILMVVSIGSDWWEPMDRLKHTTLWRRLTVDNLLALGALVTVLIATAGPWLVRNLRRPPQLFVLLRDFQSTAAAELARSYVRSHGGKWGYWLTLENADLTADDAVGGEAEIEPNDDNDGTGNIPVGAWLFTSLALSLVLTAMLVLSCLDSAPLVWMREKSVHFGSVGEFALGLITIVGILVIWITLTLIILWLLHKLQRKAFLPGRIDSREKCQIVLDTIFSRVRRRATTLSLGPLPIVSTDDEWWQQVVLRCVAEARLVVFVVTERKSAGLKWEMDEVRQRFDSHRTLYIELRGDDLKLTDGIGCTISDTSKGRKEDQIEAAVHRMLVGDV